ncbi:MAG: HEAT repeat domain-containing protein [Planctomycetaceae bacterium]|nr:HEAT repeat domain-containing protein [Planctomycetaceae bacterium]
MSAVSAFANPYDDEAKAKMAILTNEAENTVSCSPERARAAEALGYMRCTQAENALIAALKDKDATVRRNAALALAWCGGKEALVPLTKALDDTDWTVRQAAAVARDNLTMPGNVLEAIQSDDPCEAAKGFRSAGTAGLDTTAVKIIAERLDYWETKAALPTTPTQQYSDEKVCVQTALHVLGRSKLPETIDVLCKYLRKPQWTRYAADALGELASQQNVNTGQQAVEALLDVFPTQARRIDNQKLAGEKVIYAPATYPTDIPHLDARDRILAAPYFILFALSRIPLDDPQIKKKLKQIAPLIAQQIPLDIDRLVYYEEEPYQKIFRYVLECSGEADNFIEHVLNVLENKDVKPQAVFADKLSADTVQSPVLRGQDEPFAISCDVSGWNDLYLVVDPVDNYQMDRADWADAKLTDIGGKQVYLDTLKPAGNMQQHDKLLINRSAGFPDLRIGKQQFSRGLHTHAASIIHYKLDGKYKQFFAQTGVCASRGAGVGSVRFIVSPKEVAIISPDNLPTDTSFCSNVAATLCRNSKYIDRLVPLLEHPNHWVRINIAKTLLFIGDKRAVKPMRDMLAASKREADFGEFAPPPFILSKQGQGEFNDLTPRYREALIMCLGNFRDNESVPLLINILNDENNSLGIRHRSALALDKIATPQALKSLQQAERDNPFHSIRTTCREALWRHNVEPLPRLPAATVRAPIVNAGDIPKKATLFVFIKGNITPDNNPFQMDGWRQAYMTTDSGPVYRPGNNLYVLDIDSAGAKARPLTHFTDGYVADCEVSFDGKTVWFTRREKDSPWYHIFRIDADGKNLQQITYGKFHDVQPCELPSGRIAFSSTRLGTRDEYHGYPATGLTTMSPDGTDIQVVGFNFGRDSEPSVADTGNILVTRLELFYSRMKTEYNLLSLHPDGTQAQTLYGPERRAFWRGINGGYTGWFAGGMAGGRHRLLRLTQPQPFDGKEILMTTPAGPVLTEGRFGEKLLRKDFLRKGGNDPWVITTAIRLDEKTLLVAAGEKPGAEESAVRIEKRQFPAMNNPGGGVALGIYTMEVATGKLTLLYADPQYSCFEARVLHPRRVPPAVPEDPAVRSSQYTGTLYVQSVFNTQEQRVKKSGRLLRVVEGLPQVTRHATHTIPKEFAWKNHGGAFGRDLGIIPLAADGSFAIEVPADRFIALQVLDSDRNVVGNQLMWMNVRPGENKGCIGCHEVPDTVVPPRQALAMRAEHPKVLPFGEPMQFQAKVWFKGHLEDEREERQRTVQSANWLAR